MSETAEGLQCSTSCRWVVDGVSLEAQQAARASAERAGMSLGQWTQAVILEAAGKQVWRMSTIAEDHRPGRRYF